MAFRILLNESNASRRAVPIWLVGSDGTTPITNASGATFMFQIGGAFYGSGGSLSVVSANAGEYVCAFADSKVSVLGPGVVMYQAAATLPASSPFEIVPIDSYDSMRLGLFALPNAAPGASNGLIAFGTGTGQLHVSSGSVGLKAQVHSEVTIQGLTRALNLSSNGDKTGYSIAGTKTTLDALNDITGSEVTLHVGTHSGATIQGISNYANISNVTLHPGTHSSVTIQGVTRINSGVTLNADTHSGATIQGLSNYANISNVTLHPGTHSNVTIQGVTRLNSAVTLNADTHSGATIAGIVAGGIIASTLASGTLTAAKFAAGAIDAAALASDAGQEIADALLGRNIAGGSSTGRTVAEAFAPLRNRILIEGSVGTVYATNDSTSLWTFSPSLGTAPIAGIDPTG